MVKKLLLLPLLLVGSVLVAAAFQPSEIEVARSRRMSAPAAVIFTELEDFHAWHAWSPWEKLDPAMKKQFGGTAGQPGASYAWEGNEKVGSGQMTLKKVERPKLLAIELQFLKPWQATNQTLFTLTPDGTATNVTWTMRAHNDYVGKIFSLVLNMDKMVGPDFERGLEALDKVSAAKSGAASKTSE